MYHRSSAAVLAFVYITSITSVARAENVQECQYKPVWNKCLGVGTGAVECATFQVPKDWTDASAGDIPLNLIRYPSSNPDAESIILNFGGPGESGIAQVLDGGESYATETGGKFHIVSFDPRGVGVNMPYNCDPGVDLPASQDFSNKTLLDEIYKANQQIADNCNAQNPELGTLIGTVADARDVRAIAQAVGVGDKLIRYWGFSYGTLLGDTIARLFPDEIAGMVLDGNINPNDYWLQFPVEEASNIDAAIEHFFDTCSQATEDQCKWTTPTGSERSKASLLKKWDDWVGADPTKEDRGRTSNLTVDQSYNVRNVMYLGIKRGYLFIKTAEVLQQWYDNPEKIEYVGDLDNYTVTKRKRQANADSNGDFDPSLSKNAKTDNVLIAITGADNQFRPGGLSGSLYGQWLSRYNARSKYGGDIAIGNLWSYAPWVPKAKEFFTTPFSDIKTKKEIIFVQTPFDPVTPNESGEAAHRAFSNSVIVKTQGVGHCSGSQESAALKAAVKLYWTDGTVPVSETQYPLDNPNPFIQEPAKDDDVDAGAGSEEVHQKRAVRDFSYLWGNAFSVRKRDIVSGPASVGSCSNSTTSTTGTATSTTTGTTATAITNTANVTGTVSGTTTGTITGTTTRTGFTTLTTTSGSGFGSGSGSGSGTTQSISTGAIVSTWADWDPNNPEATGTWGNWDPNKSTATPWADWDPNNPDATGTWGNWDPSKPTATNSWNDWDTQPTTWALWSSQSDSVPMTKTICSGKDCRPLVVAVPTVTTYLWPISDICETGLTTRTVTITATCAKGCDSRPTGIPQGFTTTQVYCSACADPSSVVITVKAAETGSWSEWVADGSVKATSSAKPTEWSAIPVASSLTPASAKTTQWSAVTVATPADPGAATNNKSNTSPSATSTNQMIAKYTGGAVANAVTHGGVFAAFVAAAWAL